MIKNAAETIKENYRKKTLIIYDTDGDGIGAAAILFKTLRKILNKSTESMPASHDLFFVNKDMFEKINGRFDFIITVDVAVDERPEYILKLAKKAKILIIDHHQTSRNLNKIKNIVHVNPNLWKIKMPSYKYCTSKIVYDICIELAKIENLDWMAGIGIINDKSEDVWRGFLNKIYKKYEISFSDLKLINDMVTSGYNYSGKNKEVIIGYKAMLEASNPIDILKTKTTNSKKLKIFYDAVENEISSIIRGWKKNAEIIEEKKLIILKLDTKLPINSPISNIISTEKPNYTLIVAVKKDKFISISLRRQDKKVDCGKVAMKITKYIKNSSGGGHAPAAGIRIMVKDWEFFRKKIQELL